MNWLKGLTLAIGAMTLPAIASVDSINNTDHADYYYRRSTTFGRGPRGNFYYGRSYSAHGRYGYRYGYRGGIYHPGHR